MLVSILRRLIAVPMVLWATSTLTFLIIRLVPGDAVDVLAATLPDPRQQAAVRAQWGLCRPLWSQYATFMGGLVHGDLGVSLTSGVPVGTLLASRFPATIELAVVAMLLTAFLGIGLGVVAAAAHNSWLDYASRGLALLGFAVPWFWFALMLIALFAVQLHWAPVSGRFSPQIDFHPITNLYLVDTVITGNWPAFWDALRHLALPVLALGLTGAGFLARTVRATLLEALHQDYIRTARAKGLRYGAMILRHASPLASAVMGEAINVDACALAG